MSVIGGIFLFLLVATMVWMFFEMGGIFAIIATVICIAAGVCAIYIIKSLF